MELIINSAKNGTRIIYYDECDEALIQSYTWRIKRNQYKEYAATNLGRVNGKIKSVTMHILLLGREKGYEIDHKDGNGLNNKRDNLRFTTRSQNGMNKGVQSNSTTGYKGVSFSKSNRKYEAYIKVNGKKLQGGSFKTINEAAIKYNEMAVIHHGEFAFLNKITNG